MKIHESEDIEVLTIDLGTILITSIYKPPNTQFNPTNICNHDIQQKIRVVISDFNSHSPNWSYGNINEDGQKVEEWAEGENLTLIHDPKLPTFLNSGRWERGYNPDLIFVSDTISHLCTKEIGQPVPNTQHRPTTYKIMAAIHPKKVPFRRFNFQGRISQRL